MTTPTAAQQVEFLANLQRLLQEGGFVATYKHALLLALADVSVEQGNDSGQALAVPVSALAEKFITYYWRQAAPFSAPGGLSDVLKQNTGKQAAIVRLVRDGRRASGGSLASARGNRAAWSKLVSNVTAVVKTMPLWKLQTVGDEKLDFLYPNEGKGSTITLRPGVAFCFRRFHGLVEDLVRGAWVRFVRNIGDNQPLLGQVADLDEFLFGSDRADLSVYREILAEVQSGACFYCQRAVRLEAAVDHFVPWSRYPVDLAHNFVLTHASCNQAKGDRLAAVEHLERWCVRNVDHADTLADGFAAKKLVADLDTSASVTRWAYEQVEASRGLVWVATEQLIGLEARWRSLPGLTARGTTA